MKKRGLRVITLMLLVLSLTLLGCRVKNPCQVEIEESTNGTILLEQDLGSELDFRAIAEDGYVVGSWTIEGGEFVEGGEAGSKTAKIKIKDNFKISVTFVKVYEVSFNVHGGNGTLGALDGETPIESSTIKKVVENTEIRFIATAVENYEVDFWTIEGGEVVSGGLAGNTEAVVRITEDVTVSVSFKEITYNVIFSVDSENSNGSVVATFNGATYNTSPVTNIPANTQITFSATADDDYKVGSWTITGGSFKSGGADGETTAIVVVNSDTSVEISFVEGGKFSVGEVSFSMKKIDAVTGITLGYSGQANNQPHQVSLSKYWIGETEVTQELWEVVMGSNPSYFQGDGNPSDGDEVQEKRPVEEVSWFDCITFCNELTKKVYGDDTLECVYYSDSEFTTVYDSGENVFMDMSKKGFRLPTEAEWEYAAKGGEAYTYSGSATLDDVAWYNSNSNNKTHQVKMKAPNGYGLYDMSGNVWEWCFDNYGSQPASGSNPVGSSGSRLVRRGGSFNEVSVSCVFAARYGFDISVSSFALGLRLAGRF